MGGNQKGPLILLIFTYVNKEHLLILNMLSKVVYVFLIKSYEFFKFQIWKFKVDYHFGKRL